MNLLIVCHYGLYQDLSCSFVHAQAAAYAALGHQVRVLIPLPYGKADRQGRRFSERLTVTQTDGVELYDLRFLSLSNFGVKCGWNTLSAKKAVQICWGQVAKDFVPDVIHAHTLGLDSELGAWLKQRLHCPLVVTTHGSDTSIPVEQGRAASLKPLCDAADRIVAVSSTLADKLRTSGTMVPISVILNGFQLRFLLRGAAKVPMTFLQVGNLLEQKKFYVTIQAFSVIREQHPEAVLTIIGQGPERPALEGLCRKLGVEDAVRFLGQVPNEEVLDQMARAQFFCMPSVREGFGIVYLEAMASGCITIGTEGEGIANLIKNGENGFLVPPDDPDDIAAVMEWCLAHPEEATAIADRGRQDALSLTWDHNAEQYIKLFKELCS